MFYRYDSSNQTTKSISRAEFLTQTSSIPSSAKIAFLRGTQDVLRDGFIFYTLNEDFIQDIQTFTRKMRTLNLRTCSFGNFFKKLTYEDLLNQAYSHFDKWPFISYSAHITREHPHYVRRVPFFEYVMEKDASGVINIVSVFKETQKPNSILSFDEVCKTLDFIATWAENAQLASSGIQLPNGNRLRVEREFSIDAPFSKVTHLDINNLKECVFVTTVIENPQSATKEYMIYTFENSIRNRNSRWHFFERIVLRDHFLRWFMSQSHSVFKGVSLTHNELVDLMDNSSKKSLLKQSILTQPYTQVGHIITSDLLKNFKLHIESQHIEHLRAFLVEYAVLQQNFVRQIDTFSPYLNSKVSGAKIQFSIPTIDYLGLESDEND